MLPRTFSRIQRLAKQPVKPVTIQQLLSRSASVSDREHVRHAQWCRDELPVRVAHRLHDFLRLPHIVVTNRQFHEVFGLFLDAFEALDGYEKEIKDPNSVDLFATTLRKHVRGHDQMLHTLQEGHGELQALLDELIELDAFLNQTLVTRIGNRVLAEHFLLVNEARRKGDSSNGTGVVRPACRPASIVEDLSRSLGTLCSELYGVAPKLVMEGELDTELSFIYEHLHFMLQEIIKNAFRATIESHGALHPDGSVEMQPIKVEIMKGSFDITLKVSDCGGGMRKEKLDRIWRYGYTSTKDKSSYGADVHNDGEFDFSGLCGQDNAAMKQLAGYGFGLPLSRIYARYFGGDIHVQSMYGYGTDVYLNLNHLGDMGQNMEYRGRDMVIAN